MSLRYNLRVGSHDVLAGLDYGRTTVTGGNYSHQGGRRDRLTTQIDNNAESLEVFLIDRWQFAPQWTLVYGVQGVVAEREVENVAVPSGTYYNPKGDYDSINPRAGLIYQLTPEAELFANVSKLYEAPTTYELEDDACGCDASLDAMQGTVLEIGTRGRQTLGTASQWHWDLAVYYAQLKDVILSKDDPTAPGTSLSTNVDDTVHAGLEAVIGASFALDPEGVHRIEPLMNLTVNEFSFDDDPIYGNNELPAAPGYAIRGEILYRHTNGFFFGPTFDVVDARYADFSNSYTVDSYHLLGLRTGYTQERWEVFGEIRNLTDEDYIAMFSVRDSAGPTDAILTPGEPRSAYVGVKLRF